MRIYILEDKEDTVGMLSKVVNAVKNTKGVTLRVYLVADGEGAWELAEGLGVSGILKKHYTIPDIKVR